MVKEIVKYIDGTEHEIDVKRLGFRKTNHISRKFIPIKDLSFAKDERNNDIVSIKGDIDLMGMSVECLSTIDGLDLDKLESSDADRIYKKYFEKDLMSGLSQGGNPN